MIWFAFALCFTIAALLAGIESALITVSRVRARHAAEDGDKRAARLVKLLQQRQDLMRTAMTMHHFFTISAFVLLALICRRANGAFGIAIALAIAAPLFLTALELAPKSLFRQYPFRLLKRCTTPLLILRALGAPLRIFGRATPAAASTATGSSLDGGRTALVREITALKLLPENTAALLARYHAFAALSAADVAAVPDRDAVLPASMPLAAALKRIQDGGRRHYPVIEDDGSPIGSLDATSLPSVAPQDRLVRHFVQPVPRLDAAADALQCLRVLRQSGAPFATLARGNAVPESVVSLESLLVRLMNIGDKPVAPRK